MSMSLYIYAFKKRHFSKKQVEENEKNSQGVFKRNERMCARFVWMIFSIVDSLYESANSESSNI